MHQTYIFLTETFLEKEKLEAVLSYSFFHNQNSFQQSKIEAFKTSHKEFLKHCIANGRVIIPEIDSKKEFSNQLFSFYQQYSTQTLLFLGHLNQLSIHMQEGMLKLLEEPPTNLYIVLTAEQQSQILPTIISRSQLIKFPEKLILQLLDQKLSESVRTKLPEINKFYSVYINDRFQLNPDYKKLERKEIDLWLWQLEFALRKAFLQKKDLRIAKKIEKVLYTKNLNKQSLQKKFVFEGLLV